MRTGFVIGVVMLYLVMWYIAAMVESGITMNPDPFDNIAALLFPNVQGLNWAGLIVMSPVYITNILGALFLQFPGLMTGNLQWIQWYLFNPIAAAMCVAVVFVIRGVPNF